MLDCNVQPAACPQWHIWQSKLVSSSFLLRLRCAWQERVKCHFLLTTGEVFTKEAAKLQRISWEVLVVDKAHRLRNPDAELFQASTA